MVGKKSRPQKNNKKLKNALKTSQEGQKKLFKVGV